jgi:hypothetical protein
MENDIFPPRSPGDGSGTFCPNGGRTTRGAAGGPSAWTALDVGTAGLVETTVGRLDDAQRHLREARDLGKRFDDTWLAAWSRVLLGTLAVVRGRLAEARALLEEGLALSLAAHSTRSVTLCLTAFAQLMRRTSVGLGRRIQLGTCWSTCQSSPQRLVCA